METTEQSDAPAGPSVRRWPDRLRVPFVWGVWAVLSAGLVGYVWLVNDDIPIADDWHLVPVYTGHEAVTPAWLWAPHNEHRLPLPKLLLVVGDAVTGHDYRTGVLLSALALSALAGLMIVTAGRLRGGPSYADVFFPLALLHWGQFESLLISYALNLVLSTVLAGLALLVIVRVRGVPSAGQGLLFGLLLLALPLCGFNGVVLVPPLAVWSIVAAVVRWRAGGAKGWGVGAAWVALALAALALVALCLFTMQPAQANLPRPPAKQVAETAAQFFTQSLGPIAEIGWPVSGVALGAVGLITAFRLRQEWRAVPTDRLRILGLFAFAAALVALALAIGWGRGGGFATRYATMAAPALCLAYIVARAAPRREFAVGLSLLLAALFVFNTVQGIQRANKRREEMRAIQRDVAAGMTPAELAKKWTTPIYNSKGEAILTAFFEMLREAHQGPYRNTDTSPKR